MGQSDTVEVRELKAALERTVDELEEQRVAAIELRMLLDASEARLRTMAAELEEARDSARAADEQRDAARVEAIEMRVILDATEHRASKLQEALEPLARERDALATERDRLQAELLETHEARRRLEAAMQEAATRIEEVERRAAERDELRAAGAEAALERERLLAQVDAARAELAQRDGELESAQKEVARLAADLDSALEVAEQTETELRQQQREVEVLSQRLRDLERRPAPSPESGLRLASSPPARPGGDDAQADAEATPASPAAPPASMAALTLLHLDDRSEYCEALASVAQQFPGLRYVHGEGPPVHDERCLVVANLLAASDALGAIAAAADSGASEPRAFTYCGDGARGVVLGTLGYFPEPFDVDACAARLLEENVQRLLTVSDDIELTNEVRSSMAKFHVSTSVALDGRQAVELAALVRPEFVLVDLGLPRGEALRVVARLRLDAKTAAIPVALLWNRRIEPSDLRAYAARVGRDTLLAPEDLRRALVAALSDREQRAELLHESA